MSCLACNCSKHTRDGNGRHDWDCQSVKEKKVRGIALQEDCGGCRKEWKTKSGSGKQTHIEGCLWLAQFKIAEHAAKATIIAAPEKKPKPENVIACSDSNWARTERAIEIPAELAHRWNFDKQTRVLLGRLEQDVPGNEKKYILEMAERTDIALILEGAIPKVDDIGNEVDRLCSQLSAFPHARLKFKRYERSVPVNGVHEYEEQSQFFSMSAYDFQRYLKKRWAKPSGKSKSFRYTYFVEGEKRSETISNVDEVVLYMYDVELPLHAPKLQSEFEESFKLKQEMYHGGRFCYTNILPVTMKKHMGSNVYLTPPGSWTLFHLDGKGTVDSGHFCAAGYNEVVMLARNDPPHLRGAMKLMKRNSVVQADALLYESPHDKHQTQLPTGTIKSEWPIAKTIKDWERMNCNPCVFILKPGQLLHINKGRPHCFRKLANESLPEADCHFHQRKSLLSSLNETEKTDQKLTCLSVAHDWQFTGISKKGIEDEAKTMRSSVAEIARTGRRCLGIVDTAIIFTALSSAAESANQKPGEDIVKVDPKLMCAALSAAVNEIAGKDSRGEIVNNRKRKNDSAGPSDSAMPPNPLAMHDVSYPINPYGPDYECILCHTELFNSFYHCIGCEKLMGKDFDICHDCYSSELFRVNIIMAPQVAENWDKIKRLSFISHRAKAQGKKKGNCSCSARTCIRCKYCCACSCICHLTFERKQRFFDCHTLANLQEKCKNELDKLPSSGTTPVSKAGAPKAHS